MAPWTMELIAEERADVAKQERLDQQAAATAGEPFVPLKTWAKMSKCIQIYMLRAISRVDGGGQTR